MSIVSDHLAGEIEELRTRIRRRQEAEVAKSDTPNAVEDWAIRWISMNDMPLTSDVHSARTVTDNEATQASVAAMLKKLEKKGWLKSSKTGKELRWSATEAGEKVMA